MFKKKILIIDDSKLYTMKIVNVLELAGFTVMHADNGIDGLRLIREMKPDLLLLDVVMPGLNGFEICRMLRASESNNMMPIIMLTSDNDQEDVIEGLELGADDYIIKPFNDRELTARVKNTLVRLDRMRDASPLTGLPGNHDIVRDIESRIEMNQEFSVIYADIDNFKAYNDVYGFSNGDIALKLTADIIRDQVALAHDETSFIGHVGGDDFIIVTGPAYHQQIAEGIISEFDNRIKEIYHADDLDLGFINSINRRGEKMKFPIMTISLAIVTNVDRKLTSHLQVAEIAAELKKKVKTFDGSNYLIDRRRE